MGQLRKRGHVWWIRYYRNGRQYEESAGSDKKSIAIELLKIREGDGARGVPVTPKVGRLLFDEAAEDVLNDYRTNGKKSVDDVERRITKHLKPFFGGRRLATITTTDVRTYIANRQAETTMTFTAYDRIRKDGKIKRVPERSRAINGASNAEINRELTLLKRMFSLAIRAGKLLHKPHVPLLREDSPRTGFFEREQFEAVRTALPDALRPVITFAYLTGWRVPSEVLTLEWRHVDRQGGVVRLDVGTTKNREGRTFPYGHLLPELRDMINEQWEIHTALQARGLISPWVFPRRRGADPSGRIGSFRKTWRKACLAAGLPGPDSA
jgi:integrase